MTDPLSPPEKAALLLLGVGKEVAAKVLAALPETEHETTHSSTQQPPLFQMRTDTHTTQTASINSQTSAALSSSPHGAINVINND